jgi:putative lipase involved disintegration of autophagic bodies
VVGDNPDVDTTIVGDNPDVGIGILGDNPEVWINGVNINDPVAIYNVGVMGASNSWVKTQIADAVSPLQEWMSNADSLIGLTADGLAQVILTMDSNSQQIAVWFNSMGERMDGVDSYLNWRVDSLLQNQKQTYSILSDRISFYKAAFIITLAVCGAMALFSCVAVIVLWRQR